MRPCGVRSTIQGWRSRRARSAPGETRGCWRRRSPRRPARHSRARARSGSRSIGAGPSSGRRPSGTRHSPRWRGPPRVFPRPGRRPPVVAVVQGRQRQEDQVRLVGEAQLAPRGEAPPVRRPRRRTSRSAEIGAARAAHERAAQPPRRVPRTSSASVREPAAAARAEVRPRRDARRQAGRGRASRPCAPRTSARHGREAAASRDSTRRKHPWLSPSARWPGSASLRRVIPRRSPRSFVRISQGPARRAHRDGRAGRRS
jgi:hypothetical protein